MTIETPFTIHDNISALIAGGKLSKAFRRLREIPSVKTEARLNDRLNLLEETYRYMIQYLVEGYADEGREKMLSEIVVELQRLNDIALRNSILPDSEDIYSSTLRFERMRKASLRSRVDDYFSAYSKSQLMAEMGGDRELEKETENALSALFAYVWTMFGAPDEEYREITRLVLSPDTSFTFKAQMVSALLLGNLRYFDKNAFSSLLDIYDSDPSAKLAARVLVAIFLIVAAHGSRIMSDNNLKARLSLWEDSIMIYPRLREVLMNMLKARDTERINRKMQNELLPEIMKLRPEIINKLKNASEEMDMESLEENPEWEELLNKNGIADKLKELTDLQLDGADVMMMAFSNLKNYPFFNTVSNWFLPFYSQHSEVTNGSESSLNGFAEILDMEGVMCDSDKFSFAFSLNRMPPEQKKMIEERMNMEIGQLKELMANNNKTPENFNFDAEVTRYIRNLYRFFKLFRRKGDFIDPFAAPIDFRTLPYLSNILSDPEILGLVGEFYFRRGYYKEALPLLLSLEKISGDGSELWEKIGYAYNALNQPEEALIWYRKAELLNPDSQWLIKKLALVSRMLNRHDEAAEYYARALENDPDNFKLLISAGNCLLEAGKISEALTQYYHAEYLMPGKVSTLRAIAWAELLNGNIKKSSEFYSRILESGDVTPNDLLNSGHAAFLSGNLKQAVSLYSRCASDKKYGLKRLEEAITQDLPVLKKIGADELVLEILLDKVRYDLA